MISITACQRLLRALLVQELADGSGRAIRHAEAAAWPDDFSLDAEGLGLDSLELEACGTAVNQFFRLHETGLEDYLLAERRLDAWVKIIQAGLAEGTTGFTFQTSGSSGEKKPCTHSHASLAAEVAYWAKIFADRRRIIQLVPPHHIYGAIFTILLPEAMGIPVLDCRAMPPGRLARILRADDLLVGFPAGWSNLLRSLECLPAGIRAVSSTAPLPASASHALRQAGAAEVIEIYGSSETAGIAWRAAPDESFTLLPHWRPGASGARASVIEVATGQAVALPDRAEWDTAGGLRLLGRKDQAVQVGGINVFPALVAAKLASHPLVAEAAVRLDETLPEPRLKAFVILRGQPKAKALDARELEVWCRSNFAAPERPVRIEIGQALPRNAMGKMTDWPASPPV